MHIGILPAATVVLLSVWAPFFADAPAHAAPRSVYTEHRYAACPAGTSPEPGIIAVRVCSGPAGIPVKLIGEPDSATLRIGRAPVEEPLGIGSFYEPTAKIEWLDGGDGRPSAAIVRYRVGKSVGALNESRLVVYRLEASGKSCVMGVVREPGANTKARALVERSAAGFGCGSSRPTAS